MGSLYQSDSSELAEYELSRILPRLKTAEKNKHKECPIKIYRLLISTRPGISGFIADLFKGRVMSPGRDDVIANIIMERLRKKGYACHKVINRNNGIVKVMVSLPPSSSLQH